MARSLAAPEVLGPILSHIDTTVLPHGERRELFVVAGRFTFEPQDNAETIHSGGYAIPGLVDAHAHLAMNSPQPSGPVEDQIRASARAQLQAGVLALREPGSPSRAARDLGDGLPRVSTAGRFLATPGGYFPGPAREVTPDELPVALESGALVGKVVVIPWGGR